MPRFWNTLLCLSHRIGIWTGPNQIHPSQCLSMETPGATPQLRSTIICPNPMVVPPPTAHCCRKRPLAWRSVPVSERSTLSRLASPQSTRCALSSTPLSRTACHYQQERVAAESLRSQARRTWGRRTAAPQETTLKAPARAARSTPSNSSRGQRNNSSMRKCQTHARLAQRYFLTKEF